MTIFIKSNHDSSQVKPKFFESKFDSSQVKLQKNLSAELCKNVKLSKHTLDPKKLERIEPV